MRHLHGSCALCLALAAAMTAGCHRGHQGSDSSASTPGPTPTPTPTSVPPEIVKVADPIQGDTTWQQGKVYVIQGPIAVNATLTVEQCAVVKFDGATAGLDVGANGKIVADGVADCPVVFTSIKDDAHGGDTNGDGTATAPARRDWRSVVLAAEAADGSTFRHAEFLYAGAKGAAADAKAAALEVRAKGTLVDGCTFAHDGGGTLESPGGALDAGQAPAATTVTGTAFFDDDMPIVISQAMSLDGSNDFHDPAAGATSPASTYSGIFVAEGAGFTGQVAWGETEVAYVMPLSAAATVVSASATLTLGSGVVVKLPANGRILVDGVLKVLGTAGTDRPVVFTSIADDTRPTDPSDTDGAKVDPATVKWGAIYLLSSGGPHIDGQNLSCANYSQEPQSCVQTSP